MEKCLTLYWHVGFRFDGTASDYRASRDARYQRMGDVYESKYRIPTVEGDNQVKVAAGLEPVPWYSFELLGNDEGRRGCGFGNRSVPWQIGAGGGMVAGWY